MKRNNEVLLYIFKDFDFEKFYRMYTQSTNELKRTSKKEIIKIKCLYIQDCVIRLSATKNGSFTLHSQILIAVVGREYRQILDVLIKMKLIKKKTFMSQKYKVGEFSMQYTIPEKIEYDKIRLISGKIKKYKKKSRELICQMKEDTVWKDFDLMYGKRFRRRYVASLRKITLENIEGYDNYVKELLKEKKTGSKSLYYMVLKDDLLDKNKEIESIDYSSGAGRIYHVLTHMKREIKKFLNIAVMLDASNSQPLLLSKMIFDFYNIDHKGGYNIMKALKEVKAADIHYVGKNLRNYLISNNIENENVAGMDDDALYYLYLVVNGLLWDKISEEKHVEREIVKTTMFKQVFYSNTPDAYKWKEWAVEFAQMFPTVYLIIGRWKMKPRPKDIEEYMKKNKICPNKPTAALSIAMQALESKIMVTILKKMYKRKWYAVNLHDCIIVPKIEDKEKVPTFDQLKKLMDEVYMSFGLSATFK